MNNYFILATNNRSLNFFWPGKIDTATTNVFTNTSSITIKQGQKTGQRFSNNSVQLLLYTCLCLAATFLIIKRFLKP